ncbi:transglutaminase-like putative cysteine protease [Microbacterium trichothecenolyticum]|uniref:Transglutaminase-like putative cysteine protease n=1 Tax=Microbacterium trichothecenolyticum TaxID=69370 RepID=A0ABU0U0X0_MICTR|nr:transglutaminase-like putative cysteine protease [Microbacterium trichothecenolyticum]
MLGVIPTPATVASVPGLLDAAAEEIRVGVAPVVPGFGLSFLLVAAVGALAVVLDHVVLTARMPLLAAVGLVAVSLIPTIAIPSDVDVVAFVLLAVAVLFLLRVDTRARSLIEPSARPPRSTRRVGASATALGVAAVAVIVAVVATPLLPQPGLRFATGGSGGAGTTINPNLELGNDLRQPREVEVLTVRTTGPTPPYLRAVTLSSFDGSVWQPDSSDTVPVRDDAPVFDPLVVDDGIAVDDWTTDIDIDQLDSPWLPLPYPASTVTGLQGDWLGLPQNRTVVSRAGSTRDQVYQVQSTVPRPSLEQIRARSVGGANLGDAVLALPAEVPAIIGDTAREVTAGTQDPYDALIALQTWFRSSAFRYSLDAPVEAGFDGAGLDAVADFLQVRSGYCVHYASAFAVMARTLGMPSRIVVGYLPGTATGPQTQGQMTFTVSSSQLHAWPEVYFDGIGWVPFEPTNSLGVPTSFTPSSPNGASSAPSTPQQDAATPNSQPSTAPTQGGALDVGEQNGVGTGAASGAGASWIPATLGGVLLVLLAAAPAVLRSVRRRGRLRAARAGDPIAAWTAMREDAVDLGIPAPGAESPRAFAARLSHEHGADTDDVDTLREALERVSYAEDAIDPSTGARLAAAVESVRERLTAGAPVARRIVARLLPRSLFVRSGEATAASEPVGR